MACRARGLLGGGRLLRQAVDPAHRPLRRLAGKGGQRHRHRVDRVCPCRRHRARLCAVRIQEDRKDFNRMGGWLSPAAIFARTTLFTSLGEGGVAERRRKESCSLQNSPSHLSVTAPSPRGLKDEPISRTVRNLSLPPLHRGVKKHINTKGNELSVRSLFIFLYFTRWRLIFIEVVFSNGVVRSSTLRTCL